MGYKELLTIYYESKDDYLSAYEERFSSPDTIKLPFDIKENQAFFVRNAEIAEIIFKIQKIRR